MYLSHPLKLSSLTRHCEAIYWGDEVADFIPERFIDTIDYRWPRHACKGSPLAPR